MGMGVLTAAISATGSVIIFGTGIENKNIIIPTKIDKIAGRVIIFMGLRSFLLPLIILRPQLQTKALNIATYDEPKNTPSSPSNAC